MNEKFARLFGANEPVGEVAAARSTSLGDPIADSAEEQKERRQLARIRLKRRLLGLAALVLALLLVIPALFEPSQEFVHPSAKLGVPSEQEGSLAATVELNAKKAGQGWSGTAAVDPKKAQRALSRANRVSEGSAELIPDPENKPVDSQVAQAPQPARDVVKTVPLNVRKDKKPEEKTASASAKTPAAAVVPPVRKSPAPIAAARNGRYFIQVLATSNKAGAETVKAQLSKIGLPVYLEQIKRRNSALWRVRVGRFATQNDARAALDLLALNGIANGGVNVEAAPKK